MAPHTEASGLTNGEKAHDDNFSSEQATASKVNGEHPAVTSPGSLADGASVADSPGLQFKVNRSPRSSTNAISSKSMTYDMPLPQKAYSSTDSQWGECPTSSYSKTFGLNYHDDGRPKISRYKGRYPLVAIPAHWITYMSTLSK